jgi:hypothetical protein
MPQLSLAGDYRGKQNWGMPAAATFKRAVNAELELLTVISSRFA